MDIWEKVIKLLKNIPKDYYLPLGIGCTGLILLAYGFYVNIYLPHSRENYSSNSFSQPHSATTSRVQVPQNIIKVDVEGAVTNPGVYVLASDARLQDGLIAAGGLSVSADRNWVAQHINLALKLIDGTKIYIPEIGQITENGKQVSDQTPTDNGAMGAQNQQIDINSASETDLDSLPGIGPATANKIIAGRPYASIQDLQTRKIVGAKEFEKIKDLIVAE